MQYLKSGVSDRSAIGGAAAGRPSGDPPAAGAGRSPAQAPPPPLSAFIITAQRVQEAARLSSILDLLSTERFFWIDLVGGDEPARAAFLDELAFDEADLAWVQRFGQPGRLSVNQYRLRASTWIWERPGGGLVEVHLLSSRNCVVTVWNGDPRALEQVRLDFAERLAELERSPAEAAAILMQLLLATLHEAITEMDGRLQTLQSRLRSKPGSLDFSTLEGQLGRLQSDWSKLDRYSGSVRTAIIGLEALPGMDRGGAMELSDYAEQVDDMERRLQQRAAWGGDLMHDFATALAQRQARQITRLTVISTVFLPIIFLTVFFGTKWMSDAVEESALVALGLALPAASVVATLAWLNKRRHA